MLLLNGEENIERSVVNAEKRGKATANLQPISNVMSSFLNIMKDRGYIKDFQVYDPHRVGKITVELQGRIIKDIRVLMYRQDLKAKEIEEYRLRTLPTRQEQRGCTFRFTDGMFPIPPQVAYPGQSLPKFE